MIEKTIDQAKLAELMSASWSYPTGKVKAVLTEEDKEELAIQVTMGLGAEIVDDVLVVGRTEVSE